MSSDLHFTNTKSLKFFHTKDGVIANYKKRKFILGFRSISNENTDFTDQEYLSFAQIVLRYHCTVRNVPMHSVENIVPISSKRIINDFTPFHKYVPTEIFERYISKGIFQLGTIEQYRKIEDARRRDEFEGYSFLNLNINNHIVSSVCISGFSYLIFSATRSANSLWHREKFGGTELYFTDIQSFAENLCKSVSAKRYFIQNVEYKTLKLYICKKKIHEPKIDVRNILTPAYFEIIKEHLVYPGLFVKPESFVRENEVRIVFEMPKDQTKPYRFENKALLNYVEVVNNKKG